MGCSTFHLEYTCWSLHQRVGKKAEKISSTACTPQRTGHRPQTTEAAVTINSQIDSGTQYMSKTAIGKDSPENIVLNFPKVKNVHGPYLCKILSCNRNNLFSQFRLWIYASFVTNPVKNGFLKWYLWKSTIFPWSKMSVADGPYLCRVLL